MWLVVVALLACAKGSWAQVRVTQTASGNVRCDGQRLLGGNIRLCDWDAKFNKDDCTETGLHAFPWNDWGPPWNGVNWPDPYLDIEATCVDGRPGYPPVTAKHQHVLGCGPRKLMRPYQNGLNNRAIWEFKGLSISVDETDEEKKACYP